jgi:effector-binding domain-containing protein
MKALKIIGIIVGVLVAAILIIPLFAPATAKVSSEVVIALEPARVFPFVASYKNQGAWDPWLNTDSTAVPTIESKPGYVGSTYSWKGEKLGTGRMEVTSVKENEYIGSELWFGDSEIPATVEWTFEAVEGGTRAVWSFSQETAYPFGRLGMMMGKVFLQKSFDLGLSNLKAYLEANPPEVIYHGAITMEVQPAMVALVARGGGTMETIGEQLSQLYSTVWEQVGAQSLQMAGAAFVHYLDYDEATGFSNFKAGFQTTAAGKSRGKVESLAYPEMKVIQTLHTGPYEAFVSTYKELEQYIMENGIGVTGEVFEFYTVNMETEKDPAKWQTVITMPLK